MPITCPNGHVNDAGNRFCDQCGAQLPAAPASGGADIQAAAPVASAVPDTTASASGSLACPTCGQENLPGTAFCENCGAQLPLPEVAQAPAATDAPAATVAADGTISCPNCGTDNDPSNAFCEQCGASLAGSTAAPAAEAAPVADESAVSTTVADDDAALAAPGAQSQPATEETQPPVDAPTSAETDATIPPLVDTPATSEPVAPVEVEIPATPAEPVVTAEATVPATPEAVVAQPAVETCVNCGAELPPNAKFCLECGTKVERKPAPAPEPELVRPTNCQNCGAELPPNAKFCLECGTKVELIPADTAKPGAPAGDATNQQQASQSQSAGLPSAVDLAMQQTTAPELPTALDVAMQRADAAQAVDQPPAGDSAVRTYDAAAVAPVATPPAPVEQVAAQPVVPVSPPVQQAPVSAGGPRLISTDGTTISLPPLSELVVGREDPVSGIHPDIDMTPHGGEAGGVSRRHAILRQQGGQWSVTDLDSTNYTRVDGNRVAPNTDVPLTDGARIQFGRIQFEFRSQ